jgi:SAM-dependent methyltransferase
MINAALTHVDYWETKWSRADHRTHSQDLQWISRDHAYSSFDRLLRAVLPHSSTKRFIELGSGPGRWLIYFHKRFGYQVEGCDYSPVSCAQARQNLAQAGIPGTIRYGSFLELQEQYDIVFSGGVIEHFENPGELVERFARLVRPGGILITDVPNLRGINGWYSALLAPQTFDTHRVIKPEDLRHWHRASGLSELLATSYGSFCLSRVPAQAFKERPWLQRLWTPVYKLAAGGVNRVLRFLLQLGVRLDHPMISPHLLVVAQKLA